MWMDAYVQHTLIRQQIAESNRTAAMQHLVRSAKSRRGRTPWWTAIVRFVPSAAAHGRRSTRQFGSTGARPTSSAISPVSARMNSTSSDRSWAVSPSGRMSVDSHELGMPPRS